MTSKMKPEHNNKEELVVVWLPEVTTLKKRLPAIDSDVADRQIIYLTK